MKVFVSWSGERSRQVAELFKDWLKCVIQACDPWISTQDIESGSLWFNEIGSQLSETTVGIICLTKENKDKPWILFEAGALTKGLSSSRVIPFLVDLAPLDLRPPLSQLNATKPNKNDVLNLAKTVNFQLKEGQLTSDVFRAVFETYWPQFEQRFSEIIANTPDSPETEVRPEADVLSEILLTVRGLGKRLGKLENQTNSNLYNNNLIEAKGYEDAFRYSVDRYLMDNFSASSLPPTYDIYEVLPAPSLSKGTALKIIDRAKFAFETRTNLDAITKEARIKRD